MMGPLTGPKEAVMTGILMPRGFIVANRKE